jgi:hypothetical protein
VPNRAPRSTQTIRDADSSGAFLGDLVTFKRFEDPKIIIIVE